MVTPFTQEGKIHEATLRDLVNFLIDGGVHGIFPVSSTGEASSLTLAEKKEIMDIVVDETHGRVPVLPGTGSSSTKEAIILTHYAEKIDADGVILVTPYYLQPDQQGLRTHFSKIAETTELPIVLYQIPQLTGVKVNPDTVASLEKKHDNIMGLKDSSGDLGTLLEIARKTRDDFLLFQGKDGILLPSLLIGCSGGINATTNIKPSLAVRVYDAFIEGNLEKAKKLQLERLTPLFEACSIHGVFPAGFKDAAKMIGMDVGPPRSPIRTLTYEEKENLKKALIKLEL